MAGGRLEPLDDNEELALRGRAHGPRPSVAAGPGSPWLAARLAGCVAQPPVSLILFVDPTGSNAPGSAAGGRRVRFRVC